MTRDVVTVTPDAALMEVQRHLKRGGFHHLVVVDDEGTLQGVISDRDVLGTVSPFLDTHSESARDVHTLECPACDIMREDPMTISPDTSIADAAALLFEHAISSLPVVDGNGQLVGIVTTRDLLWHYADAS